jgi:hypothetical protein
MVDKIVEDAYLGDGVYASFDGHHIVLDLRGQDRTTRIGLEPRVMEGLRRYADNINQLREEMMNGTVC